MPHHGMVNWANIQVINLRRVRKAEKARRRAKNRVARKSRRINRKETNHRNWK